MTKRYMAVKILTNEPKTLTKVENGEFKSIEEGESLPKDYYYLSVRGIKDSETECEGRVIPADVQIGSLEAIRSIALSRILAENGVTYPARYTKDASGTMLYHKPTDIYLEGDALYASYRLDLSLIG